MGQPTFVRGLWGFPKELASGIWQNVDRARSDIESARLFPHQPTPIRYYVYGCENAEHLDALGYETILLADEPLLNFTGAADRNPSPDGKVQYGLSVWRHKMEVMKTAILESGGPICWLDWDVNTDQPIPPDFWDCLDAGQSLQLKIMRFVRPQCPWRGADTRLLGHGGLIYCRDVGFIQDAINWQAENPLYTDEHAFSWVIDQHTGGWKGIEFYHRDGWEPYCYHCRKQPYPADVPMFREYRGQ